MTSSSRSAAGPAGLRVHRTASHTTTVSCSSDTVYTFSFTTDWFHTVKLVAPTSAHTAAAVSRAQRSAKRLLVTSCATRNQIPADAALATAARRLMRTANSRAIGSVPNRYAISTNSGLPGGCGIPTTFAAAMYSLVSHIAVVGASVAA